MSRKNHIRPIPLYKVIEAHETWCNSQHFSPNTLRDYQTTFKYFLEFIDGATIMNDIKSETIIAFLGHMEQTPISNFRGITAQYADESKPTRRRSAKTLRNYHIALSSLWTFATEQGYASEHVVRAVRGARVPKVPIHPLTEKEIKQLLDACEDTRSYRRKPGVTNWRITADRDKAMIALLTESALRASELVNLRVRDVKFEPHGGWVHVRHGKGDKSRNVPFGPRCANYLRRWLILRDNPLPDDPFFTNVQRNEGMPIDRQVLARLIQRLGRKCGIQVSPHRLRTTAACLMVQNGMNAWQLRAIMGHESIQTTQRYVQAANVNLEEAMRRSSPLQNIRM